MSARRKMKKVVKECIKRILPITAELLEDELETKKKGGGESGQKNGYCEEVVKEPQLDILEN
jgi:hypothetical protein